MCNAVVTLKKGEGRILKSGGMWVFDNEIAKMEGNFENGDMITIHDFDGYPMGKGFINLNSKIRVRLMTRDVSREIDRDFLYERVKTPGNIVRRWWIQEAAGLFLEKRISCPDLWWINFRMCLWWNPWRLGSTD